MEESKKKSMIPKKIHWCWLSDDPLPQTIQECISSWRRVMPDYEIICWDKKRFDIDTVPFVRQAYAYLRQITLGYMLYIRKEVYI